MGGVVEVEFRGVGELETARLWLLGGGGFGSGEVGSGEVGRGEVGCGWLWAGRLLVRVCGRGVYEVPFVVFELPRGIGDLFSQVAFGAELVELSRVVLFLFGEVGGAVGGMVGCGEVASARGVAGMGVIGLGLLSTGGDVLALRTGPGLAVKFGGLAFEFGGFAVGLVFGDAELVDAVGEFGAAGAGEAPEPVEVVFGVGALFGGVGGALGDLAPALLELVGFTDLGGLLAQVGEVGVDVADVVAVTGGGGEAELLGVLLGGGAVAGEPFGVALECRDAGVERGVGEGPMRSLGPVHRGRRAPIAVGVSRGPGAGGRRLGCGCRWRGRCPCRGLFDAGLGRVLAGAGGWLGLVLVAGALLEGAAEREGGRTGGAGHVGGGERDGVEAAQDGVDVVAGLVGGEHPVGEVPERGAVDDALGVVRVLVPGVSEHGGSAAL